MDSKILVIYSEKKITNLITKSLNRSSLKFQITFSKTLKDVAKLNRKEKFDFIILDAQIISESDSKTINKIPINGFPYSFIILYDEISNEILSKITNVKVKFCFIDDHLENTLYAIVESEVERSNYLKSVRKKQDLYDSINRSFTDVIIVADFQFQVKFVSPSMQNLLGYTNDEAINLTLDKILTEKSKEFLKPLLKEFRMRIQSKNFTVDNTLTYPLELLHKDGSIIWTEVKLSYILDRRKKVTGLLSIIRDVSERRKAEKTLEREREAFQLLTEAAISSVSISKLCNKVLADLVKTLEFDFGTIRLFDEKQQMLIPQAIFGIDPKKLEFITSEKIDNQKFIYNYVAQKRRAIIAPNAKTSEILQQFKDRITLFNIKAIISWPVVSVDNRLLGVLQLVSSNVKDIPESDWIFFETIIRFFAIILERKQSEQLLKESEEKYRILIEMHPLPVVMTDTEANILIANSKVLELYGTGDENELIHQNATKFVVANEHKKVRKELQFALEKGVKSTQQFTLLKKDGKKIVGELNTSVVKDSNNKPIALIIVLQDVTKKIEDQEEKKKYQELLLRQKDELESFASTIAHDIRNKLQVISMYNSLSKSKYSEKIDVQIVEISIFIENLLLMAKKGEILGELTNVNLTELIEEEIRKINSITPELKFEVGELPIVHGDPMKLKQVFENILMNIVKHAEATKVKINSIEKDACYQISIEDNGCGMSLTKQKEIRKSLEKEQYSSFGLLIVQKIIEAHQGSLGFETEEALGTTFYISLPKK